MVRLTIRLLVLLLLLTPLLMWVGWLLKPRHKLDVFIMDKTVLNKEVIEHKSFNWILNHEKFVKSGGRLYKPEGDYYGFFPLEDENYWLRDLEEYSDAQIRDLSQQYDMAYFTDTYGIYTNEWYRQKDLSERSPRVYGGMKREEATLLKYLVEQKKLVLLEFNTIASPTGYHVRSEIEELFDFSWTGWTGRYFASLDTVDNPELPRWVIRLYMAQHKGRWPFTRQGMVFVHVSERIEILDEQLDLSRVAPEMRIRPEAAERFGLPDVIEYPYWLDIIHSEATNTILADYRVFTTDRGDSILNGAGIPETFPAILEHLGDYTFYYFAGDFADNPIGLTSARFRWVEYLHVLLSKDKFGDRRRFFWKLYQPLVTKILNDYHERTQKVEFGE